MAEMLQTLPLWPAVLYCQEKGQRSTWSARECWHWNAWVRLDEGALRVFLLCFGLFVCPRLCLAQSCRHWSMLLTEGSVLCRCSQEDPAEPPDLRQLWVLENICSSQNAPMFSPQSLSFVSFHQSSALGTSEVLHGSWVTFSKSNLWSKNWEDFYIFYFIFSTFHHHLLWFYIRAMTSVCFTAI